VDTGAGEYRSGDQVWLRQLEPEDFGKALNRDVLAPRPGGRWPLSQKSYKSMEQMKKIQPMIQKLREKHADDKERMNQEIMALYKTYKVNPAGGCLPMVVQIPVFFGLYKALLGSIELRHAPFITNVPFTDLVWIADLSAKDPYYVTPLIMGATMFIQQKMTPTGGDPTQAKIMLLMPVVFTFLFLSFPAGLVVYWLVNNVLSIAQQWWMMRKA
jgi:YidC/Oxa1 family membrane protein insertase